MDLTLMPVRSRRDVAAARALFERYAASLPFSLAYQGFAAELAGLPQPYAPPQGRLLLARSGGGAVGTVALRRLAPGVGEIKRLYVVPAARGGGVGRALLAAAIEAARQLGYERVRLDSHRDSMQAAIALYRRLGFVEIAAYGPDLDGAIAFFEKPLRAPRLDSPGDRG
jgi:GNAT superfamily N-acetyltransferase